MYIFKAFRHFTASLLHQLTKLAKETWIILKSKSGVAQQQHTLIERMQDVGRFNIRETVFARGRRRTNTI